MAGKPQAARTEGLGKRIRRLLLDRDLSVDQLIADSGVSRQTVYRALSDDEATSPTLAKLAGALGVSEGALLAREADTGGQWEPAPDVPEELGEENSPQGAELEEYVSNIDRILRTLRTYPTGELGQRWKLGFLSLVEEAAKEAGQPLPREFWDIRRRVYEGEL